MRAWIAAVTIVSACGGSSGASIDAGGSSDASGSIDASVSPGPDGGGVGGCAGALDGFRAPDQATRRIHVATDGRDDTGDGSLASPYATIERAANDATPGTWIVVLPGTYAGGIYLADLAGSPDAPIWIGGEPPSRPTIQGGGEAIHLTRVRHLVLHTLEIAGATNNGINCDDGGDYANPDATRYVTFWNLDIHDVGSGGNQDCLKLSGVNDFLVLGSSFARCGGGGSGSGVDHVGCHRGLIHGNTFVELSGNGVQAKGGSEDLEIHGNHFVDAGERAINLGGSTGFEFFRPPLSTASPNFEARDIRVIANRFEGATTPVAYVGCVDCLVANNTIRDPGRWLARILQETTTSGGYVFEPARDGRFVNNVVWFDRSRIAGEDVNVGPNTAADTFAFTNNLFYAHDDPAASGVSLPGVATGNLVGVDPMLAPDDRLLAGSPAIGAGVALPEAPGDHLYECYADPPSLGAFETQP